MSEINEKIALLLDMISFSVVDGKLDPKEYQFLSLIATQLKIEKEAFDALFHMEHKSIVPPTENQRIQQFYRLALLMHVDGVTHEKEINQLYEIAVKMGLNPNGTKRILRLMETSNYKVLPPEVLLSVFKEQHN